MSTKKGKRKKARLVVDNLSRFTSRSISIGKERVNNIYRYINVRYSLRLNLTLILTLILVLILLFLKNNLISNTSVGTNSRLSDFRVEYQYSWAVKSLSPYRVSLGGVSVYVS